MYLNYLREWKNAKFITLRSPLLSNVDKLGLFGGMVQNALDLALANIKTGAVAKGATVRWGFFMPASAGINEINDMVLDKKISDCEAGISAEEGVRAEGGAGETIRAQARKTERRSKSAETRRRRQKPPARFESRPIEHCQIDKCRQEMTISRIRRAAQLVERGLSLNLYTSQSKRKKGIITTKSREVSWAMCSHRYTCSIGKRHREDGDTFLQANGQVVIGLLAGALAEEDKPVKRQVPVGHRFALVNADGPRVDPRQLGFDPQQEIDPRQIVDPRQYAIDPRQLGPLHHPRQPVFPFGVDPRQLQGLGPQPIPGDPSQQQ
ncbi:unnamed protein product, partial [Nesidiocoris tenuis]